MHTPPVDCWSSPRWRSAFVLLVGAGLLFSSFQRVLAIDPGFDPEGVLTASVNLPPARYAGSDGLRRFADDALPALRAIPGVVDVGATSSIPFAEDFNQDVLLPEGYSGQMVLAAFESTVTPSYFETMRVRLIGGRFFDERDTASAPRVVIVDERLANRYWPGVNPIGRRINAFRSEEPFGRERKDPSGTRWWAWSLK